MTDTNPIELLLPAGDFQKMKFAYAFGADATYLGIPRFSLRARENGFKKGTEIDAINYAHGIGKKAYLTANIIPHNHKVEPFMNYVDNLLTQVQPDAWIMSDPGMIMMMKEKHPEQEIHLSVQANSVNYASARFWGSMGVKRIILSREISIKEIKQIRDACPDMDLEAFVHGSICIAYSGRCLISNYMSNRDPNQGTCSHSCRWEYKMYEKEPLQPGSWLAQADKDEIAVTQHGDTYVPLKKDYYLEETERPGEFMQIDEDENGTYLMNARDLCAIEHLDALVNAGVNSLKVEGRSKSVYYAAVIARAYRRALSDMANGNPFDDNNLSEVFSTSHRGLITGFLFGNPGRSAQKFDKAKPENSTHRFSGIVHEYDAEKGWIKVEPRNPIRKGMTLELLKPTSTTELVISELYNTEFDPIDAIHGGLHFCYIPIQDDPGEFALLREKLI